MLACLDVSYGDATAIAGCVLFETWTAATAASEHLATTPLASPYRPGEFYLRELPAIVAVLAPLTTPLDAIVIDGYVWLGRAHPGLGARLYEALGARVPIVGVAKTAWGGDAPANETDRERSIGVVRGASAKPLFVTSVGLDVETAARHVASMHGEYRLPTLLKRVDTLVREVARAAPPP